MNQPSLFPEPRRNAGLFSQYYLDEILLPSFGKDTDTTGAADLAFNYFQNKFDALLPIIEKNKELASTRNEAQLEEDVIRPILKNVLGHIYDVQVTYKGDKPDYFLFSTEDDKRASKNVKAGSSEYEKLNIGILDAKAWKHSTKPEKLDEANISQIFRYLINFNKRWGVLTNGFRWILFANKPGIRQDQYIEFDLSQIVEKGPASQDFKLFIFLFRRQAFEIVSGTDATLDKVLEESFSKAAKLQNDLKTKVYEAFKIVAEEYRQYNKLKLESEQQLAELKETSLVFLYRILFLLYGESRLILPVRPESEAYYSYSLERLLVEQIENRPNIFSIKYWNWLNDLFGLIHGLEPDGSRSRLGEDIGLPAYDGGLFDPVEYKKLDKWKLGDKAIKDVMDLLAYTGEKTKSNDAKRVRVSYRDLGVQHLGNIYEGILENKLILKDGTIDVVTDNFERHATGSYYTPDYIVDYIVKETLQPIVDEALAVIKPIKKRLPEADVEEAILRIKVLDPAMGSGHFLIGAIDFLAEQLVKKGNPDAIYTEAELQECRRRVGERCVYGVDLNPMAVELAKLSIWLHTLSQSKPLTFLDNHIKWGNSLIGARLADLHALPDKRRDVLRTSAPTEDAQASMFPESLLNQEVKLWLKDGEIFTNATQTIEDVKAKEKLEAEIERHREKYKHLADLWTACYFIDAQKSDLSILFRKLSDAVVVGANEAQRPESELLDNALAIAKEKRFFHWELEFPEIFFDEQGRLKTEDGGFDAVIGNPPYVIANKKLLEQDKHYFLKTYPASEYQVNLYSLFMEGVSSHLLHSGSFFSFIVPNSWLGNMTFEELRHKLLGQLKFDSITYTPLGTFEGVSEEMVVFISDLTSERELIQVREIFPSGDIKELRQVSQTSIASTNAATFTLRVDDRLRQRLEAIERESDPVKNFFEIIRGVNPYDALTGQSQEIIKSRAYHANFKKDATFVPELKGRHVMPYTDSWDGKHWISYGEWLAAPRDPRFFEGPRIVFREILGKSFVATILQDQLIIDRSLYIAKPKEKPNLPFFLSLLNSKLLALFFRVKFDEFDSLFPKIRVEQFRELPIRTISFTTPKKEREKLTKQLISESELAISSNETEEQIKRALDPVIETARLYSGNQPPPSPRLGKAEEIIKNGRESDAEKNDVLHDFLSHLAEEMLAMNKEKQALAQDFFMWMENYNIPPRSALKPKTFLDEFWKKEFKHILAHLTRNKVQIGISNETKLQDRFNTSSKSLLDLDKKIALTDWLIDQVVYALYGLTDEEIGVVERG